jgi:hypothetical protein
MFLNRWIIAILVYILVTILLIFVKPSMMFTQDGNVKQWSIENTETTSIFSPMIVFPILSILSYYLGIWIELVFNS